MKKIQIFSYSMLNLYLYEIKIKREGQEHCPRRARQAKRAFAPSRLRRRAGGAPSAVLASPRAADAGGILADRRRLNSKNRLGSKAPNIGKYIYIYIYI